MRSLLFFFSILIVSVSQAQNIFDKNFSKNSQQVIQLSGIVIADEDTIKPLHYVNIGVKNTARGTTTNYEGFFSLPLHKTDTIIFSIVGYKKAILTVPQELIADRYSIIQTMKKDTIQLPETVIYPWPSPEEFKRAFIELDIPDDEIAIARKNLAKEELRELGKLLPTDGREATSAYLRNESKKMIYRGQTPPNNLLNPFAWIQFFKLLKEGKMKIEK